MAIRAKYLYVVRMDVEPDKEADFNEIYDKEHIPALQRVPGVLGVTRYETSTKDMPKYVAIYEMDSPDLPSTQAWKNASDSGTWKDKVRPFTKNRSHTVYRRIEPKR
jgi:antibiotic biosynthesis monooxygenase (ABM) superfamily enzyme